MTVESSNPEIRGRVGERELEGGKGNDEGVVGRVGAVGAQADAGDCWRQTGDDRVVL